MDAGKIQYIIELLKQGDTKDAVAALRDVQDQASKSEAGLKSLADTAKTALAAIGSVVAVREAVGAFVDHEKAVARLGGTLKATGQYSDDYAASLASQRDALEKTTDANQTTLLGVQTLLISFGAARQDMPALTQAVLDLAAGMGVDAGTAAIELSKALEGVDGPLKRMGITFDDNAGRGEKLTSAVAQISARFGGLAQAVHNTPAGALNDLQKSVENLKIAFGQLALEGLSGSIANTTKLANATRDFLQQGSLGAEYTKELVKISAALASLAAGTKVFQMLWAFTAGDAIKQAGGLAGALNAIPKTIQIAIIAAAVAQVGRAGSEFSAMSKAQGQESDSKQDLGKQNDARRANVDKLLQQRYGDNPNRVGAEQMESITGPLDLAAQPKVVRPAVTSMTTDGMEYESSPEVKERDEGSYSAAITAAIKQLTGVGRPQAGDASSSQTGNASSALLADQKKGMEELEKLQEKMQVEALDGFTKQREEAQKTYGDQENEIDNIIRKYSLDDNAALAMQTQNITAYAAKMKQIDDAEAQQKQEHLLQQMELEARINEEGLQGIQRQVVAEQNRYDITRARLAADKNLSPTQRTSMNQLNDAQYKSGMNNITQPGYEEDQKLIAAKKSLWAQHVVEVDAAFEIRKEKITAYYDWVIEQVQDNDDLELEAETEKDEALQQLEQQRQQATSQYYQMVTQIGTNAAQSFSNGMASAIVSTIQNWNNAGQAFEQFAANFLQQVAQMILQLLILNAIKSAFGGMGIPLASGGIVSATPAAHGIMLAAAGVAGVNEVNGPTYFPSHNVLAGEAGREVMTVMARPSLGSVNGQPVMMGSVGASKLALLSQQSLSAMISNPQRMASGGMAGVLDTSGGINSGLKSSTSPQANGKIVVELTPHPAYETKIISNSISGARAQIATDLQTDSPISRNVKGLVS